MDKRGECDFSVFIFFIAIDIWSRIFRPDGISALITNVELSDWKEIEYFSNFPYDLAKFKIL